MFYKLSDKIPLNRIQGNKPLYLSIRRPCTVSTGIVIAKWQIHAHPYDILIDSEFSMYVSIDFNINPVKIVFVEGSLDLT